MNEKTLGYLLLTTGILIMVFAASYMVLVFTGSSRPLKVFDVVAPTLDIGAMLPQQSNIILPQHSVSQKIEVLPTIAFNQLLNMGTTLLLMGFVLSFGFKIASLGTMLLRPIVVKPLTKENA